MPFNDFFNPSGSGFLRQFVPYRENLRSSLCHYTSSHIQQPLSKVDGGIFVPFWFIVVPSTVLRSKWYIRVGIITKISSHTNVYQYLFGNRLQVLLNLTASAGKRRD